MPTIRSADAPQATPLTPDRGVTGEQSRTTSAAVGPALNSSPPATGDELSPPPSSSVASNVPTPEERDARRLKDWQAGEAALPTLGQQWSFSAEALGRYLDAAESLGKQVDVAPLIGQWLDGHQRGAMLVGWCDEAELTRVGQLAEEWNATVDPTKLAELRRLASWFGKERTAVGIVARLPWSGAAQRRPNAHFKLAWAGQTSAGDLKVSLPALGWDGNDGWGWRKFTNPMTPTLLCDPASGNARAVAVVSEKRHGPHYSKTQVEVELGPPKEGKRRFRVALVTHREENRGRDVRKVSDCAYEYVGWAPWL